MATYFPEELPEEREAIAKLVAKVDAEEDPAKVIKEALAESEEWRGRKRKTRRARYRSFSSVYRVLILTSASEEYREAVFRACERRKIPRTAATHIALLLVKLILDPPEASACQYALALRQAVMELIPPDGLAERLRKKGWGIDALARRFSRAHPRKKPPRSDTAGANGPGVPGNVVKQNGGVEPGMSTISGERPFVNWGSGLFEKWVQRVKNGNRAKLTVRKVSDLRWMVLTVEPFE